MEVKRTSSSGRWERLVWSTHDPDEAWWELDPEGVSGRFAVEDGRIVQPAPISACYGDGPFVDVPDGTYLLIRISAE